MRMQNLALLLHCTEEMRSVFSDWDPEDLTPVYANGDHEKA